MTASGLYVGTEQQQRARLNSAYAVTPTVVTTTTFHRKGSWQDPLAIFVAVAGVGAGVAIVFTAVRGA